MKKVVYPFLVLLALSITSVTVTSCSDASKTETIEVANFQCPMKCEEDKKYDKEGACPVCGMELKKVETTEETGSHSH